MLRVRDVKALASEARQHIEALPGVATADIHLELDDGHTEVDFPLVPLRQSPPEPEPGQQLQQQPQEPQATTKPAQRRSGAVAAK